MSRAALLILLFLPLQEPDFLKLLVEAEKLGLTVPGLPDAVAKLDARAGPSIPPELAHRHLSLRAQATVLSKLNVRFAMSIDKSLEMPDAKGAPVRVKILGLKSNGLRVARQEGEVEMAWSDINAEWAAAFVREDLASDPDARLLTGLWLAKAGRWDAAFRELADSKSLHPLVAESRRRGLEGLLKHAETAAVMKRWKEAVDRLKAAMEISSTDSAVEETRGKVLAALVEQGREHSRKGSKKAMEEIVDLIAKDFPGSEEAVQDIREESKWITISDPKKFGATGRDGEPILLNGDDAAVWVVRAEDVKGPFDGISVRIRFSKVPKQAHGGPNWDRGALHAWVIRDDPAFMFARHDEVKSHWNSLLETDLAAAETYDIRVVIEKGEYVCSVNGIVKGRAKAATNEIKSPGVQASHGRLQFDRFRLRKK